MDQRVEGLPGTVGQVMAVWTTKSSSSRPEETGTASRPSSQACKPDLVGFADDVADLDGGLRPCAGFLPCLAVVSVTGEWPADYDDQAGAGVDDRWFFDRSAMVRPRAGTRVPSTMSTVTLANHLRDRRASISPR